MVLSSGAVLHCRTAKVIYNLPRDMPSAEVYQYTKWSTLNYLYKLRIIKLFYWVVNDEAPAALLHLAKKASVSYSLKRNNNIVVPTTIVRSVGTITKLIPSLPPSLLNVELPNILHRQSLATMGSTLKGGRGALKMFVCTIEKV